MTYLISLPDTKQSVALIDYIKIAGLATKIKAIKDENEFESIEIPARSDKELIEMISYNKGRSFQKYMEHDDSGIF